MTGWAIACLIAKLCALILAFCFPFCLLPPFADKNQAINQEATLHLFLFLLKIIILPIGILAFIKGTRKTIHIAKKPYRKRSRPNNHKVVCRTKFSWAAKYTSCELRSRVRANCWVVNQVAVHKVQSQHKGKRRAPQCLSHVHKSLFLWNIKSDFVLDALIYEVGTGVVQIKFTVTDESNNFVLCIRS